MSRFYVAREGPSGWHVEDDDPDAPLCFGCFMNQVSAESLAEHMTTEAMFYDEIMRQREEIAELRAKIRRDGRVLVP